MTDAERELLLMIAYEMFKVANFELSDRHLPPDVFAAQDTWVTKLVELIANVRQEAVGGADP